MITWWISYEFRYITTTKKTPVQVWFESKKIVIQFSNEIVLSEVIFGSIWCCCCCCHSLIGRKKINDLPSSSSTSTSKSTTIFRERPLFIIIEFSIIKNHFGIYFFWKKTIKQNRTEIGLVIILSRVCVFAMRNAIFIFLKKNFYLRKFCFFYYRKKQAVIFLKKKKFNDYPMMMVDSIHFIDTYDRCVWPVFFIFKRFFSIHSDIFRVFFYFLWMKSEIDEFWFWFRIAWWFPDKGRHYHHWKLHWGLFYHIVKYFFGYFITKGAAGWLCTQKNIPEIKLNESKGKRITKE